MKKHKKVDCQRLIRLYLDLKFAELIDDLDIATGGNYQETDNDGFYGYYLRRFITTSLKKKVLNEEV